MANPVPTSATTLDARRLPVEEFGSTTVVFPGLHASVDDYANLLLERNT